MRVNVCSISHTISGAPNISIRSTCLPSFERTIKRWLHDGVKRMTRSMERRHIATASLIEIRIDDTRVPRRRLYGSPIQEEGALSREFSD